MKGLNKLVNDLCKDLSAEVLGREIESRLSTKLVITPYKITNRMLHFNKKICEELRNNEVKIACVVIDAVKYVKGLEVENEI
jgi:hypothetical protein